MAAPARKIKEPEQDPEDLLEKAVASFYNDPYGFVCFIFPWLAKGTPLEAEDGPDTWQTRVLVKIGEECKKADNDNMDVMSAIQIAVASGHGIGKTALIAWIILWFVATREAPQIIVTANTKTQLDTKTWRELAVWYRRCKIKHWFTWRATKFFKNGRRDDWYASCIPWSKERPTAFQGAHEKYILMIFDEASEIPDIIWETVDGAMTTKGAIWIAFGNPTSNTGRFKECFGRFRARWHRMQIDSRTCKMTNKAKLQEWIDDYGEDSDFVRVRVRGVFPRFGTNQLIPEEYVELAQNRIAENFEEFGIVVGVDPARKGADQSVIYVRQGPATLDIRKFRGLDTQQLAYRVAEVIQEFEPDLVVVDAVGIGAGVYDKLDHLGFDCLEECNQGWTALEETRYFNIGAECWWKMRDWLHYTGAVPANDNELRDELTGREYGYDNKDRIQLERKKDMKERGLASPDTADALSLTFYRDVPPREKESFVERKLREREETQSFGTTWMSR